MFLAGRNGLSSVKALQSEEDRTSLLREESDGLQTRLAALDLRTREAEVTKSDLQSSVNALNHSIAVLRRQVEKLASEKEAFREKQRLLAYFQQRDESSSSGDSKAAAATPVPEESLSHLRNMEDLYRSAWRDLSLTEGQADETDESIAARREQLGALRVQLQLRDIEGEKMKQQTAIFQQQAQDLAVAVEEALRTMTSQANLCLSLSFIVVECYLIIGKGLRRANICFRFGMCSIGEGTRRTSATRAATASFSSATTATATATETPPGRCGRRSDDYLALSAAFVVHERCRSGYSRSRSSATAIGVIAVGDIGGLASLGPFAPSFQLRYFSFQILFGT